MELLQHVVGTLRFPGPDDDPVTFAEDPTVTVARDSDGSVIVEDKAATKVELEEDDPYYTVELSGTDLSEVDLLKAVWSDGSSSYTTYAEVVGGFVTSLKSIKAKYGESDKTDEEIAEMREIALRSIEDVCGVAFRSRYSREVLDGTASLELIVSQPRLQRVLSASVGGEALALDELVIDPAGIVIAPSVWSCGRANVEIAYVHGYEDFSTATLPVRDLAAHLLTKSPTDWNERATSVSDEMGTYSLVTAGVRGASFPLPSVNAFVENHSYVTIA